MGFNEVSSYNSSTIIIPGVEFVANLCLKYGDIIDHSNEGDQSCNQISSR